MKTLRALALGVALAALPSCGDGRPPEVVKREVAPSWQDVFDGTPELYAVIRPQRMKRDPLYGNFFKALMRVAQARAETGGALEAAEGCDEILVGISKKLGQPEDAAIVFRGVPASLDPQRITDASGHPMFRVLDARATVPELERIDRKSAFAGSLFVLPDRTWVVATGDARARARLAFASPSGRPVPRVDVEALATVRLDAEAFLRNGRFGASPATAALVKKLSAATIGLMPGKGGVVVKLQYDAEDSAAWAELHAKRVVDELAKAGAPAPGQTATPPTAPAENGGRLRWLNDAKVSRDGNAVVVRFPIPPRLLEELPNATGGDVAF